MFQDEAWKNMDQNVSLWDPEDIKDTKTCKPVDQQLADNGTQSKDENGINQDINNSDSDDDLAQDTIFDEMQIFCQTIGEPQLANKFLKHKVTLGQLMIFDEQDLINCGIDLVGDRKKILSKTVQMHNENWMPSCLNDPFGSGLLSSPGYYIAINDINKHIEYISLTIRYLEKRLQENPKLMELGKDIVGVNKLASEIKDLLRTSKATHTHILSLSRQVAKHVDNPILKPANHIDENYLKRSKIRAAIGPTVLTILVVYATFKLVKSNN